MLQKLFCVLLLIIVSPLTVFAQSGSITGRVVDRDGFPMPGATVLLVELPSKGTVSDANGRYTLVNVPVGSYTVRVSYIGYATLNLPVVVRQGESSALNVRLEEAAKVGDEVIVLGDNLRGQARALNQQRNNMNITNVVSSDQVGRFPDANIGDALKRVSGITIQNDQGEARNIIIRGMAPQLNSVTLNGERMPSAEGDNRLIQLDLIPADMIQSIEVSKAVLPDMDADAIGGSVNLITKSTPSGLRFSGTAASGMNFLSNKPIWNGSFSVGNRFADDKLGVMLSGTFHSHDFGSDNIEGVWTELNDGRAVMDEFDIRKYLVRRDRRSGSIGLDYRVNDRNVIYLNGMYNWRDDWENRYRMRVSQIQRAFDRNQAVDNGNGTYNLPARVEFQTKGGLDNDRIKATRLEDQRTRNLSLGGDHLFGSLKTNWSVSIAKASEERPNERYISYRQAGRAVVLDLSDTNKPNAQLANTADNLNIGFNQLSEQYSFTSDQDLNAKIDLLLPYSNDGFLKFGGKIRSKNKERENNFYFYRPLSVATFGPTLGSLPYSDQTDSGFMSGSKYRAGQFVTAEFLGGLNLENGSLFRKEDGLEEYISGNYNADEQIASTYAMVDHQLSDKLSAVVGLRIEATSIDYTGNEFDVDEEVVTKNTGSNSYVNVMPGLHLRYAVNENSIVRFAWTNTLARPGYFQLVPYALFVSEDSELERGNPDLKATTAMNFDLMAESYFSNVGIVSAGVFYKDVNNFIYNQTTRNYTDPTFGSGLQFTTALNGGTADVFGFEVAIQRQLWKGLGVYLNYTRTESSTSGVEGRENDDLSLPGTAKNMFNGSLSYETSRLSLRTSLNYASDYVDELGGESFEDRFYDRQTFIDVNGSYTITPKIRVFAEVNNLTNQPLRYYQGIRSRMMQEEFYNVRMNFGIKMDLIGN
jgi:TonB-dependent receptor